MSDIVIEGYAEPRVGIFSTSLPYLADNATFAKH